MRVVVCGASGFIGPVLLDALRSDGHQVVQLVRRPPRGPQEVQWEPATGSLDPSALGPVDAAINLSGAGVGDERWNDERKRVILQSRLDTTLTLATALAALEPRPRVLLNASAIGYYGHRGDEVLTERSAAGDGFLADVVRQWEAATQPAVDAGLRVVPMRVGLVMAPGGGAFGPLLPLFRLGLGGRLGNGRMWWSWVTRADVVDAVRFLLVNDVEGPVNLTGPAPVTNAEFTKALGAALHRPAVLAVPRPALRLALGEFADDVTGSQRVLPQVLLDAGFPFRHTTVEQACAWLAGSKR